MRISVTEDDGKVRYSSSVPGQPTADQLAYIRENKIAIIEEIRLRDARRAVPAEDEGWSPPTAYHLDGSPNDELWASLATRLLLEVPDADRRSIRGHYQLRLAFWRQALDAEYPGDALRMAYVDLESMVVEKFNRRLAVWFSSQGAVKVEGIAALESRRPASKVESAPVAVIAPLPAAAGLYNDEAGERG